MGNKLVVVCLVAGLLLVLGPVTPAVSQEVWTGDGDDNLWSNPDNWQLGIMPTFGDEVRVNGPAAEGFDKGPLIQDGIEAEAGVLIADAGLSNMTMTGGTLELAGWGTWWADANGSTAEFDMRGGEVNFTGSPGIMELAWQDSGDPIGGSTATWTMTGGVVNARGVDMPGKGNGGVRLINLYGGTLNVGTERGGLILYDGGKIDITEGLLVLEGDLDLDQPQVQQYIDDGWIVAYDGLSTLTTDYDGEFTTISAVRMFEGVLQPGDANEDLNFDQLDLVKVQQAAKYLTDQPATWGEGDWNGAPAAGGVPGNPPPGDDRFNQLDIISALSAGYYLTGPYAAGTASGVPDNGPMSITYVPEPTTILLAAIAALLLAGTRRRLRYSP